MPSPSPSPPSPSLLMPDPIRPLALLAGEDGGNGEESPVPGYDGSAPKASSDDTGTSEMQDGSCYASRSADVGSPSAESTEAASSQAAENMAPAIGLKFKRDPCGRDAPRRGETKTEWSPDKLANYLKGIVDQIDSNIQNHKLPTAEKLDAFVERLVVNTHRQLRHAPKKARHSVTGLCTKRFHRFWNFARNEKVRTTTPEELTTTLLSLVEALLSEAGARQLGGSHWSQTKPWAQPKPSRWVQPGLADMCGGA